ncbi:MAG: bifunctional adenosylcobinamide kinase/adenosylcobinamide-phosphate guanylyltransferase [Vulcanimicrobiaceae bacterium]
MPLTFVTGPVRSGKSRFAARLAREPGLPVTYIATAPRDPTDREWTARLEHHERTRPPEWSVVETAELRNAELLALFTDAREDRVLLVDSLGGWLAARIGAHADAIANDYARVEAQLDEEAAQLTRTLARSPAQIVVVSEQTGWGIVPLNASARLFRDVLGRMEQRIARCSKRAYLVVAGFAIDLLAAGVAIEP